MKKQFANSAKPNSKIVFLIDHDGCLADTNQVKDLRLGDFTRDYFAKNFGLTNPEATDESLNKIHHDMYGQPMGNIFKAISDEFYGPLVAQDAEELANSDDYQVTGAQVTDALNEFIAPFYASRPQFPGATRLLDVLSTVGTCHILTGMETGLITQSLDNKGWREFFANEDGGLRIYGAEGGPNTPGESVNKSQNIATIQQEQGNGANVTYLSFGDANSERKASLEAGATFFKVCHPGQKLASQWADEPMDEVSTSMDELFARIREEVAPLVSADKLAEFDAAYAEPAAAPKAKVQTMQP